MSVKKILVVDDSAVMRQLLPQIINRDPNLKVVATARDPYDAWDQLKKLSVDAITLDVEMPKMDGLAFLEKLMIAKPLPVLMISSLTEQGCQSTLRALELGAIDFVSKPKIDISNGTVQLAEIIVEKLNVVAAASPRPLRRRRIQLAPVQTQGENALLQSTYGVIAIGSSTGGTEALYEILCDLPADTPGIVVVQHMPAGFTNSFAQRLDGACRMDVREAQQGDRIQPGRVLIAPGDFHMEVERQGATYQVSLTKAPPVNRFRPSVDVLFSSCARHIGKHATGVILTGMGNDGAAGMKELFDAGAQTIAQDEQSCIVFGMPKEAIATGGVQEVIPLSRISTHLKRTTVLFNSHK